MPARLGQRRDDIGVDILIIGNSHKFQISYDHLAGVVTCLSSIPSYIDGRFACYQQLVLFLKHKLPKIKSSP